VMLSRVMKGAVAITKYYTLSATRSPTSLVL
jgi:hypothetical protein